MNIKNKIRNVLNIRTERVQLPPGQKPKVGSSIVFEHLRIRLKVPLTQQQWDWFSAQGWRTVDMRTDRRSYTCVPDAVLIKLLNAEPERRMDLHARLLKVKIQTLEKALKLEASM